MNNKSKLVSEAGILGAMSTILYVWPTFPIMTFIGFSWLKLDFADIPALLASILINPVVGGVIILIRNTIHLTLSTTAMVGEVSNFIISSVFVMSTGFMARAFSKSTLPTTRRLLAISPFAMLIQVTASVLCNKYIMIKAYGIPGDPAEYIYKGVVPFNLIKSFCSLFALLLVYRVLVRKIRKIL